MIPLVRCNTCADTEGSPYRLFQQADGYWIRRRVVRHEDGPWEWYVSTPEEKRKDAETANYAEWMFGSGKDD